MSPDGINPLFTASRKDLLINTIFLIVILNAATELSNLFNNNIRIKPIKEGPLANKVE